MVFFIVFYITKIKYSILNMFVLFLNLLIIESTNIHSCESKIRQIDHDIVQFEHDYLTNLRIIDKLNSQQCSYVRHINIKMDIDREIEKLEREKSHILSYKSEIYFKRYCKSRETILSEIKRKIDEKKKQWQTQIKLYNDSISNKTGYEQINKSLRNKIESLKSEKIVLEKCLFATKLNKI
ncbi:hypothetical protein EDEG_03969 [Edhazardia aedis USNM 41457]|uniref:Uncharacterized protein n=1 Tax=Edhazardia aedis (strain USNM 41457) TaxID=1003232 RepID=J9DFM5_EDHAE|nr:hypothetical protein EDEG_03969 [Edhazardia aedis USNM 41457]|eukprot:EJW01405.1 hypothetical protein EDEG_03969 [Edhazardia aedis USNM 41457]